MTLYKVLGPGLRSCHGGTAQWVPGEWQPLVSSIAMCQSGYHLLNRPRDILKWWLPDGQLWEAEGRGPHGEAQDKSVWEQARILRQLHMPTYVELVALATDFAERVVALYEDVYPADDRPRQAVQVARTVADAVPAAATKAVADAAAYAAYVAHADAATYAAADAAADAAAYAADAAANAAYAAHADAAAYTAARAARTAAYAAYAADDAAHAAAHAARAAAYAADAAADAVAHAAAHAAYVTEKAWQDARVLEVINR